MTQGNKYTPAPWWVSDNSTIKYGYSVFQPYTDINRIVCDRIETKADSHLISAAPDLLEALENALFMITSFEGTSDENDLIVDAVKTAIAKARG